MYLLLATAPEGDLIEVEGLAELKSAAAADVLAVAGPFRKVSGEQVFC